MLDCVLFHTGTEWRALVLRTDEEAADHSDAQVLLLCPDRCKQYCNGHTQKVPATMKFGVEVVRDQFYTLRSHCIFVLLPLRFNRPIIQALSRRRRRPSRLPRAVRSPSSKCAANTRRSAPIHCCSAASSTLGSTMDGERQIVCTKNHGRYLSQSAFTFIEITENNRKQKIGLSISIVFLLFFK
jgi:hypothetical protein